MPGCAFARRRAAFLRDMVSEKHGPRFSPLRLGRRVPFEKYRVLLRQSTKLKALGSERDRARQRLWLRRLRGPLRARPLHPAGHAMRLRLMMLLYEPLGPITRGRAHFEVGKFGKPCVFATLASRQVYRAVLAPQAPARNAAP